MRFFIFSFLFLGMLSYAFGAVDTSDQLYDKAAEYQEYKKKSEKLKKRERQLLSVIYSINKRQRHLAYSKSSLTQKREELNSELTSLKSDIERVSAEIANLKKSMGIRLRALSRVGSPSLFQSLFGADNIIEMDRNSRILYKISKLDIEQLKKYNELELSLYEKQKKVHNVLAGIENNRIDLENKEKQIKSSYEQKMKILSRLDKQDRQLLIKLKDIRKSAKNYAKANQLEDLSLMFDGSMYEYKGRLKVPTKGKVTKQFGLLDLPYEKIKIYHKGWFLETKDTEGVEAVYQGKVAFKGYLGEYGRVVIINHGDHYYSVYANLSDILVQKGDTVKENAKIASTGNSRLYGSGLYFEIRHFSQPQDPQEWLSDSRMNISSVGDSI